MASDNELFSPLAVIARDGGRSEMLGPVPHPGGSAVASVAAGLDAFRGWADQRDDIIAARSATADDGDPDALRRIVAQIDREITDLERYARMDVERSGAIKPGRLARINALKARRQHLRILTVAGLPVPPI